MGTLLLGSCSRLGAPEVWVTSDCARERQGRDLGCQRLCCRTSIPKLPAVLKTAAFLLSVVGQQFGVKFCRAVLLSAPPGVEELSSLVI